MAGDRCHQEAAEQRLPRRGCMSGVADLINTPRLAQLPRSRPYRQYLDVPQVRRPKERPFAVTTGSDRFRHPRPVTAVGRSYPYPSVCTASAPASGPVPASDSGPCRPAFDPFLPAGYRKAALRRLPGSARSGSTVKSPVADVRIHRLPAKICRQGQCRICGISIAP